MNSETSIPAVALAIQSSGAGAIVSEDPISDSQVDLTKVVPVGVNLHARVRIKDLVYADGTTGLNANVVLNKRDDEAQSADSRNWRLLCEIGVPVEARQSQQRLPNRALLD